MKEKLINEKLKMAELKAENELLDEKQLQSRQSKEFKYKTEIAKSKARIDD